MQNSNIQINQTLLKTKSIQTEQEKIRSKAKILKEKLQSAKQKKEAEFDKNIKDQAIIHYQTNFQKFKSEMEEEFKSQACSLELIKEFKVSEIQQFENVITDAMRLLQKSLNETEEMVKDLSTNYETAVQYFEAEERKEKQKAEKELLEQKIRKIEDYKQTIYIE